MKVAVTGASGLIGTALTSSLEADGHDVMRVQRGRDWDPEKGTVDRAAFEGLDAVVHLGGVGIADSRWTAAQKGRVLTSRTAGTTLLAATLAGLDAPPSVLLSGSAIGYYGDHGDSIIDESASAGDDFPARVCIEWEASAAAAVDAGIRVAFLRTGVVQATEGGALAKQLPFFRLGLGGRAGSGRQFLSWITLRDEVRAIRFLLEADVSGPVNLVAPEPVTNAEYTKVLGAALHRPTTILPMLGPRLLYGRELADSLLLTSQRVVPSVLVEAGFDFEQPTFPGALASVLG